MNLFLDDINAITWLKHYREPWEDVKSKWGQTFHIRQTANCQKVADVIDEWPVLYDPRATSLVDQLKYFLIKYTV